MKSKDKVPTTYEPNYLKPQKLTPDNIRDGKLRGSGFSDPGWAIPRAVVIGAIAGVTTAVVGPVVGAIFIANEVVQEAARRSEI